MFYYMRRSIYGPTSEKKQGENEQVDLSVYAKKSDVLQKAGGLMRGNINMTEHRVVNLGDPDHGQDAATKQYVDNFATYLQNSKVGYSGGIMTGILDMGDNKITNVGDPENEKDAVNKKYLLEHLNFDVIGRYLVISKNGNKNYLSLRTKKNINLSDPYVNITADENDLDPSLIRIIPNGNNLGIMQLNQELQITPNLSEPWTFLFSTKFEEPANSSTLEFYNSAKESTMFIQMLWSSGSFKYGITDDDVLTKQNSTSIDIDTTQFNHIAFDYSGNKLILWVNGKSRKSHIVDLGELSDIRINVYQLGVVSLYNRKLSKTEVVEHFVEYQVKNFTNDEILI